MVARLLGIRDPVPDDASDALAMAFCRAVHREVFNPETNPEKGRGTPVKIPGKL